MATTKVADGKNVSCHVFGNQGNTALVSSGLMCTETVRVLQELTLRPDLAKLTALFTDGVLSTRGLFTKHQKWCPQCFLQWQSSSATIYLPLLWQFHHVTVCLQHQCQLETNCPHCAKPHHPLARKLQPGFCPSCHGWLGTTVVNDKQPALDAIDVSSCQHIQKLIANAPLIQANGNGGWFAALHGLSKTGFCTPRVLLEILVSILAACVIG
jgi:hypothetical protein